MLVPAMLSTQAWIKCASLWCWAWEGLGGQGHGSVLEKLTNTSFTIFLRDDGCEAAEPRVCPCGEVCSALFCPLGTGLGQDLDHSPRAIPFLLTGRLPGAGVPVGLATSSALHVPSSSTLGSRDLRCKRCRFRCCR